MRIQLLSILCILSLSAYAQDITKIHSHNDYNQQTPFWGAFSAGASSIEVDVIFKDGELFVAHEEATIKPKHTLETLYLKPLQQVSDLFVGQRIDLQLLVDVKTDATSTLGEIVKVLEPYKHLCLPYKSDGIMITISGNRPKPENYKKYPDHIFFDCQEIEATKGNDWEKVSMISTSFKSYSMWNGLGRLTEKDLNKIKVFINEAKAHAKPLRFWATPDTKTAWARMAKLGVDFINTDYPELAQNYLEALNKNIYRQEERPVYSPRYNFEYDSKPKNIVLMIGDGNGLAQITAAMVANKGQLSIANIQDIGLVKTSSFDDLITDSAAGATAMATGQKTNNRAIGVGSNGELLKTLVEIVSDKGYQTGIITTDAITGATPASFYAHVKERDNKSDIQKDLNASKLDFFISGDENYESGLTPVFTSLRLEDFNNLNDRVAIVPNTSKMHSTPYDNKDTLPKSVRKSLEVLSKYSKPFFMVVEGAKIDSGGHANEVSIIVDEMLAFDAAIAEVLEFADTTGNTLVLVTADHETSGLGIVGGDIQNGEVQADFLTTDHTGIMVPLFAYGPQAQNFRGVYENSEIFHKISSILEMVK
jgi:alkaline phosphatase